MNSGQSDASSREASGDGDSRNVLDAFVHTKSSPHTRRAYRSDLEAFFGASHVTASTADGVRPGDVDAFLQREEASGLARSTLQRRRSTLRQFYDWLTRNGLADTNPARHGRVRSPMGPSQASTSAADTLSRAEAESLVRSIDAGTATGRRNRAMVLLMLHCALRRSEIVRVNIGDVRLVGRHAILDIRGPYEQSDAPRVPDFAIRGENPSDQTLSGRSKVPPHVYSTSRP